VVELIADDDVAITHPRRFWPKRERMLLTARRWSTVGSALLVIGALSACAATERPVAAAPSGAVPAPQCASGMAYARTELFFGKSIPGGGTITDAAFAEFLNKEVTPRFPDGFTVVPAMGQYREANGVIDHEASDILIVFYPRDAASDVSTKLDEIRSIYTKAFRQDSVLRDDEQPTCVAFR
jgi:hypothetical protein